MTDQNYQKQFQKTLLDELDLSDLPQEKKDQLLLKMSEAILRRIFLETMYRLSPEDQAVYEGMIDSNAEPQEVEKFLRGKISDYDEIVKDTLEDFEEKMKNMA